MKVIRIITKDGREFYAKPDNRITMTRLQDIESFDELEMTEEAFDRVLATNDSAEFFKATEGVVDNDD